MSVVPPRLTIEFPDSLPVSGKRHEIMAALAQHQVIIVCGETGSGKTTQLPKIALAMGRGRLNAAPGPDGKPPRGRLIGHTQPRRIAASSVAKRIAEELKTPLGEVVGYKVRFNDRLGPNASVKLMTDGILLAETQTDPLLKAFDGTCLAQRFTRVHAIHQDVGVKKADHARPGYGRSYASSRLQRSAFPTLAWLRRAAATKDCTAACCAWPPCA